MLQNITLSADPQLIRLGREKARQKHETLNAAFRKWLIEYTRQESKASNYLTLMNEFKYAKVGRRFTRDELNER